MLLTGPLMGNVYVIDFGTCIKVGLSDNINRRVHELEKSTGLTSLNVYSVRTKRATYLVEKLAHQALAPFRLDGEYFSCSFEYAKSTLLEIISELDREGTIERDDLGASQFLSVSEFCLIHKKDPGNVRRLIQQGRIPAIMLGKQWAIPTDVVPPADKRVKSGKYKDWRNKGTPPPEE